MKKALPLLLAATFLIVALSGSIAMASSLGKAKQENATGENIVAPPTHEFQSEPDKVQKGKEAIKKFSGRNENELKYLKSEKYPAGNVIQFITTDEKEAYSVNENGMIVGVDYLNLPLKGKIVLNQADAHKLARKFAEDNFENFNSKNMKLIKNVYMNGGNYLFCWNEEINGVLTPNSVSIMVNPYAGKISSYRCINISLPVIPSMKISREEAISIVKEKYPEIRDVEATLDLWLTENGEPLLRWTVTAKLPDRGDEIERGIAVVINAVTGEIVQVLGY